MKRKVRVRPAVGEQWDDIEYSELESGSVDQFRRRIIATCAALTAVLLLCWSVVAILWKSVWLAGSVLTIVGGGLRMILRWALSVDRKRTGSKKSMNVKTRDKK